MPKALIPSPQAPSAIVMIRPHHFAVNAETAADNMFQNSGPTSDDISVRAHDEITVAAATLEGVGVRVHLFEDKGTDTPDSVFPNNWFSTHGDGRIALYPMMAPSRRRERRDDVIDLLRREYVVREVVDFSPLEQDGLYLEGTGALILDHLHQVAYVARSGRAMDRAIEKFCAAFDYEPLVFDAFDEQGTAVYHTNVVMGLGSDLAMISLGMIPSDRQRDVVSRRLEETGRTIIDLTAAQIGAFAGNVIELQGAQGPVFALSTTAYRALTAEQQQQIEKSVRLVPLDMPTVELSGGSVRCTIAGVHLTPRGAP
ncbi:MAG: arginine deiminase-related protein [Pseudomonadota bacterium]